MSGAARRRGRGRATAGGDEAFQASSQPQRGGPRQTPAGAFDGPASRGSASDAGTSQGRRPSNPPSVTSGPSAGGFAPQGGQAGSRRSSMSGGQSRPSQSMQPAQRRDPALDPQNAPRLTGQLKNVDLPASFFNLDRLYDMPIEFLRRPAFNTTGQAAQVQVNVFPVIQFPNVTVWQYDVTIGNGAEKRIVQRKVWDSKKRKALTGPPMIYDGNKLAWSVTQHPELREMISLDEEEGRQTRNEKNTFRLRIVPTKKLDISIINSFLEGRTQMSIQVAEAISFLDHLLREGPSNNTNLTPVKRSFFARNGARADLGGGIEVFRGVYQSMRLAEGKKLVVNIDVANSCFWKPASMLAAILAHMRLRDPQDLVRRMKSEQSNGSRRLNTFAKTLQGRFKSIEVKAAYQGNLAAGKIWKIFKINPDNALEEMLDWKDPQTKKPTGQQVTVAEYFLRKYNLRLQFPQIPLVEMTKKGVKFPVELLHIIENQRYSTKLDETQTANMIKFAVAPPSARLEAIKNGKSWLNWEGDTYLKNYGLKMDTNQIKSNARVLPAPGVKFGNKTEQPGIKGRWDLRGKTFLTPNPTELVAWGVGVFQNGRLKADKAMIDKFVADFSRAYRGHGGKISNNPPHVMPLENDPGNAVEALHQQTGNRFNRRPQLLVFLVQSKEAFHYQRIKKSCDCRYGVVSQVMQVQQVQKGNPQYYSNVLMKVNAKLGGCTAQALPHASSGFKSFGAPTMFIGADVSHPSPGAQGASMAAITVSFDRHAGRYAASCQTNGSRVEMITEKNWRGMLTPLVKQWAQQIGGGRAPEQVFYMRDGVSEGEFAHVIQQEVPHIKAAISAALGNAVWQGKMTVIVASKRHHIRAFPGKGPAADQKGNPVPGVLIERDVTSPNEFDFFLYSHIALQGTSRPVHYTILYDDAKHPPNVIQNMIYEHCYQYMRSTTSVSLHPAVYYAHLASNRAKAHEDIASSEGPQGGPGFKFNASQSSDNPGSEAKPLLEMYNSNNIRTAMWYI